MSLRPPTRGCGDTEGVVVKAGRTISVVDGRALQAAAEGGDESLVATMTATIMTVVGRDGLRD